MRLRRLIVASLMFVSSAGALVCRTPAAFAQDEDEAILTSREKLAREFTDPLTTLPQLFVQDAYTPANYGTDAETNRVIVRAIIPAFHELRCCHSSSSCGRASPWSRCRRAKAPRRGRSSATCNCSMRRCCRGSRWRD